MTGTVASVTKGATAGLLAAGAMSGVQLGAVRLGLVREPAPELIVEEALRHADVAASERSENMLATITHLAFGAACGAVYAIAEPHLPRKVGARTAGLAYALVIALTSYQGWVPAFGALPPMHRQDARRRGTVLLAHVAYGLVLGHVVGRTDSR